jgi:hypothetical protein
MKSFGAKKPLNNTPTSSPIGLNAAPSLNKKGLAAFPTRHPLIQPKLRIGQPNDKYELEADRVADRVMRIPESKRLLINSHSTLLQRQSTCPECKEETDEPVQTKSIGDQITPLIQREEKSEIEEEEEEEEPVQAQLNEDNQLQRQEEEPEEEEEEEKTQIQTKQSSNQTLPITPGLQSQVQSMKGGGQPLPKTVRNYFEPRFDHDFSHVRVHADSKAGEAAKLINAKAFTIGNNMIFGAGQYSLETSPGKRLLAHELTHVLQQVGSKNKRDFILENNSRISKTHSLNKIQCDFATPTPLTKPPSQPDLTKTQINEAVDFNKKRIDRKLTKKAKIFKQSMVQFVQELVGAVITGIWDEQTIKLIAQVQEKFGLKKNGKLDQKTLDFLNIETELELDFLAYDKALNVLEIAENEYAKGIEEDPQCTNRGKEVDKYSGKHIGKPFPIIQTDKNGVLKQIGGGPCGPAWCAYFIMWCLKTAGVNNPGIDASARSVKNLKPHYKTKDDRPLRKGDIFFKKPTGCTGHPCDKTPCAKTCISGSGHVGFILDVTASQVTTIEGNASFPGKDNDGVVKRTRPKSEIEGALRLPFP